MKEFDLETTLLTSALRIYLLKKYFLYSKRYLSYYCSDYRPQQYGQNIIKRQDCR